MATAHLRKAARRLWEVRNIEGPEGLRRVCQNLSPSFLASVSRCWELMARPSQLRPANCKPIFLRVCGRGEGKTRSAAENQLNYGEDWGRALVGSLCSKTYGDVLGVMIEGESGMMACAERRGYSLTLDIRRGLLRHPSGATWRIGTAEKPSGSRGYQSNCMWWDEIAAWAPNKAIDTMDNFILGWRLPTPICTSCGGELPARHACVVCSDEGYQKPILDITTTPAPCPVMFRLLRDEAFQGLITVVGGKMSDNKANLNPVAYAAMTKLYQGTRKGRQELDGILLDLAGPMIDQDTIHKHRRKRAPDLYRRVVSLDPCITATATSDAAGIILLGSDQDDAYVLDDRTLDTATFKQWGMQTVEAFEEWNADCVIAEINQGGTGIVEQIQTSADSLSAKLGREIIVPVRPVWAKESKRARAEPVGALYERGRVHHVGFFDALERELTSWVPGMTSPDRLDATVHGVWHLLLANSPIAGPLSRY